MSWRSATRSGTQLVGAGFYGEPGQGAERAGGGAEADSQRRAEQAGADCGACVAGVGGLEYGRADLFQGGEHAGYLVVAPAEWAEHEEPGWFGLREHDPLAASRLHQAAYLERRKLSCCHRVPSCDPNTLG